MMQAIIKAKREPGLVWGEVPLPQVKSRDVLIKIKKTAVCGTDLHIYNWDQWAQATVPVPIHIGHEFVGTVVEVGDEVTAFRVGDRVSGEGHLTCGYCRNCRAGKRHICRNTVGIGYHAPGAFAEYLVLPQVNVYKIPDNISDDNAAILDPLGNAVHTALSFDLVGEDVLITGAGPVGLMAAAVARHVGARFIVITDVNPYRLQLAEKMGVNLAVNVKDMALKEAMQKLGMREGFDVGMEMSGNASAFQAMLTHMNHGGKIAFLGIPPEPFAINWSDLVFKGIILKGIYGREMFETWYKMIAMLQSGLDINPVITHHFSANDFQKAFDVMLSGNAGKVILDWE